MPFLLIVSPYLAFLSYGSGQPPTKLPLAFASCIEERAELLEITPPPGNKPCQASFRSSENGVIAKGPTRELLLQSLCLCVCKVIGECTSYYEFGSPSFNQLLSSFTSYTNVGFEEEVATRSSLTLLLGYYQQYRGCSLSAPQRKH